MDRLQKVYKFKYGKTEFEFEPHHKFNFIIDASGRGKTWLCKQMMLATDNDDFIVLNTSLLASIDFTKEYNSIFIIDEIQLHPIAKKLTWAAFQDTPNIFLIISRDIPVELSVDYRAIYTFHSKDRKYWLERKYDDYMKFPQTTYFMVEDSVAGYHYFKHRHKFTVSVNGKDNFINQEIGSDTTIIADGSAFARNLPYLLFKKNVKHLFLPESFEGLVLYGVNSNLSKKLVHIAFTELILKERSIEKYFNKAIKKIYPIYNKNKRQEYLEVLDLENITNLGFSQLQNISPIDRLAIENNLVK